jgi:hypothetical protein
MFWGTIFVFIYFNLGVYLMQPLKFLFACIFFFFGKIRIFSFWPCLNFMYSCKSCGQQSIRCPGHFGHIELAKPLFNPLLFMSLKNLLQVTCFHCHKFRLNKEQVCPCSSYLFCFSIFFILEHSRFCRITKIFDFLFTLLGRQIHKWAWTISKRWYCSC